MKLMQAIARKEHSPTHLYHGSGFKQSELKPGYEHTQKLVSWDRYESNAYLYATTEKTQAILLGISSTWEKKWDLKRTHIDHEKSVIELEFYKENPGLDRLHDVDCWVYTLDYEPNIWVKNRNPYNGIDTEYKTKSTIDKIIRVEQIDVKKALDMFTVTFK